jgi:hypothetical protein
MANGMRSDKRALLCSQRSVADHSLPQYSFYVFVAVGFWLTLVYAVTALCPCCA